jgi:S-adenosylmethionine:tRNA ribosyltransferase-isomerase
MAPTRTDQFNYEMPEELIAQTPVEPRDHARLLVVDRETGQISHSHFYDLGRFLRAGDLLVANESRVLPARIFGFKVPTGGKVEVLLLRPNPQPDENGAEPRTWEALVSPGRRISDGTRLGFGREGTGQYLEAEVTARTELGGRLLHFDRPPRPMLDALGQMPLPPYIHETPADPERYQTVYARVEGSAAAPTAGLHFTERLIGELRALGIGFATIVLHVGLDTFRPVHETHIEDHPMHREWYSLSDETAEAVNRARANGGRVVAVGTTSVRVLETAALDQGLDLHKRDATLAPGEGWTGLFITPGYRYRLVDALITNFHLPKTTLLMLVSAFAGFDLTMKAYQEAIDRRYRFYSFGDAMIIL